MQSKQAAAQSEHSLKEHQDTFAHSPATDVTRRAFLKSAFGAGLTAAVRHPFLVAGAGGALALPACMPPRLTVNGNSTLPGGIPLADAPGPSTARSQVFAVRGRDLADMTRRVLASLGGMSTVVAPGDTVFIKPNFLTAGLERDNHTLTGEIAKPEIVVATAEECLRAGAAKVIIGDGAQVLQYDFAELVTLDGKTHLAAEAARLNAAYDNRVQLACLNSDSPGWDPLPARRTDLGTIYASSLVTRADKLISIPVLKTHHIAHITLSLKNLMGVPPIENYGGGSESVGRYKLHNAYGGPEGAFLDLAASLRPHLAIVDASLGVEGQGPWVRPDAGRTVDLRDRLGDWLLLASTDPLAADTTAARIIGQDYTTIPYMMSAYEQGFGQADAGLIALIGATLNELRMDWQPAQIIR